MMNPTIVVTRKAQTGWPAIRLPIRADTPRASRTAREPPRCSGDCARASVRAVCDWTVTTVSVFPASRTGKLFRVPVIALLIVSAAAGLVAWRAAAAALNTWWGRSPGAAVAREVREHTGLARLVRSRFDAEVATGLALTLALAAIALAGCVVGVLALLVRQNDAVVRLDRSAARWAQDHHTA